MGLRLTVTVKRLSLALLMALFVTAPSFGIDTLTFIHTDIAGSPVAATDKNGNVVWREDYRPYGERIRNQAAAAGNRQFFHGKAADPDTGLSYFGARYYDPVVGRFMGVDAVGFKEDSLHSFNRYAYGNNNPYKFVDPDGKLPIVIPILIGVGLWLGDALAPMPALPRGSGQVIPVSLPDIGATAAAMGAVKVAGKVGIMLAAKTVAAWGNQKTLADHFARHGSDFGARSADDYASKASDFFRQSQADRLPTKIDSQGTIRVYDPKTNTFGSYNPDGTTRTFFKPDPSKHHYLTNLDYWKAQPGSTPWGQ